MSKNLLIVIKIKDTVNYHETKDFVTSIQKGLNWRVINYNDGIR